MRNQGANCLPVLGVPLRCVVRITRVADALLIPAVAAAAIQSPKL